MVSGRRLPRATENCTASLPWRYLLGNTFPGGHLFTQNHFFGKKLIKVLIRRFYPGILRPLSRYAN